MGQDRLLCPKYTRIFRAADSRYIENTPHHREQKIKKPQTEGHLLIDEVGETHDGETKAKS